MSSTTDPAAHLAERLADAQARAALTDTFDPKTLVDLQRSPEMARQVLRTLATACEVVVGEQGVRWRLMPDQRRAILRRLGHSNALAELARVSTAEPGDLLGQYLITLGANRTVSIDSLSAVELNQLYIAQQFLASLPDDQAPKTKVREALALSEFEASLRITLPTQLFGREDELGQLKTYAAAVSSPIEQPEETPIFLTGMGGNGKSALLAAFAQGLIKDATPVIWFDFDRAAFDQASQEWLTLELSRQLGLFLPALAEPLARFREQVQDAAGYHFSNEYESKAYSTSSVWSIWQQEMNRHLPIRQPIVIVLDTFEEVLLRGPQEHKPLRDWLNSAHTEGQLYGLRPILSGRVLPEGDNDSALQAIALGDLAREPAYAMLHRLLQDADVEVEKELCHRLLAEWGASPLFIRLLARFLSEENGAQEAAKLLDDAEFKGVPHVLVQGFTYRRILDRLQNKDEDLRELARMGLILRRVNSRLIEQVMAKACGMSTLDGERAIALFKTLSREVWLVEKADHADVVRHRGDLRQVMLGLMKRDDQAKVQYIHQLARAYYTAGDDPFLSMAEQAVEADYHRLFITEENTAPLVLLSSASQLVASLGEELERIALPHRAWLKRQRKYVLDDEELSSLSEASRVEYQSEQITQILQSGGTTAIEPTDYGQLATPVERTSDLSSSMAEQFSAANLRGIHPLRHDVLDDFFQLLAGSHSSKAYAADFCESPIWRTALAALCAGKEHALLEDIQNRISDAPLIEWQRPIRSGHGLGLDTATALSMLLGVLGLRKLGKYLPGASNRHGRQRTHNNDELKALLIALQSNSEFMIKYPAPIATGLLCDLTPGFIRGLDDDIPALRVNDPRLKLLVDGVQSGGEARLADFQRKSSSIGYVELHKNSLSRPAFRQAFRPLYPELYAFIRGALRGDHKALQAFTEEASLAPVWPSELKSKFFNQLIMSEPQRWTATLIHFADRCGLLHEMLRFTAEYLPSKSVIREAVALYERYDEAVMGQGSLLSSTNAGWLRH